MKPAARPVAAPAEVPTAPPTAPSGMSRSEFEDRVYIAVLGHSKLHDVAAATALAAWDKWQAAKASAAERRK